MYITASVLRFLPKVASVALLWLLSVSFSIAMPAHRNAARFCDTKTTTVKKLAHQVRAVGGPVASKKRPFGIRRHPLTNWLQRQRTNTARDDEQAIQNDTSAADLTVEVDIDLQPLGAFDDPIEPSISTRAFSPRAPRGPPRAA